MANYAVSIWSEAGKPATASLMAPSWDLLNYEQLLFEQLG